MQRPERLGIAHCRCRGSAFNLCSGPRWAPGVGASGERESGLSRRNRRVVSRVLATYRPDRTRVVERSSPLGLGQLELGESESAERPPPHHLPLSRPLWRYTIDRRPHCAGNHGSSSRIPPRGRGEDAPLCGSGHAFRRRDCGSELVQSFLSLLDFRCDGG